ncbi:MAG: YtxH domain-containing protein [Armatimonadota bacterium]
MAKDKSNRFLIALGGFVAGTVAGFLFAPQSGRRTRSLVRDKSIKYSHDIADFAGKKTRHTGNKLKGYAHEVREAVSHKMRQQRAKVS